MKKLKQIGTLAIRGPNGDITEETPLYKELEVDQSGLTEAEKHNNSIYAAFLADVYKKERGMET